MAEPQPEQGATAEPQPKQGEGPTGTEYEDTITKYIDQNPETFIDNKGKATTAKNGDTWKAIQHLLWDEDNRKFQNLIGANKEGTETGVDTTRGEWLADATDTSAFVLTPGLFLSSNNRRKSFIPRVPKQLLTAAVRGTSYDGWESKDAMAPPMPSHWGCYSTTRSSWGKPRYINSPSRASSSRAG